LSLFDVTKKKWVRISFDDGDFEDFDKDCVVEGLELYKKYKDQDPNPEGVVAPVAAAAAAEGHDCFSTMTIKELQCECRKMEISYSGIAKAALIEKLGGGGGGDERVVDDGDVTKDSNGHNNSAANDLTRYRTDNVEREEKGTTKKNNNNNDDHASDEKESTTTTTTAANTNTTVDNDSNDDGGGELEFSDDGEMSELAQKIMADNDDGNENKEEDKNDDVNDGKTFEDVMSL
jgi:hypothetical protein